MEFQFIMELSTRKSRRSEGRVQSQKFLYTIWYSFDLYQYFQLRRRIAKKKKPSSMRQVQWKVQIRTRKISVQPLTSLYCLNTTVLIPYSLTATTKNSDDMTNNQIISRCQSMKLNKPNAIRPSSSLLSNKAQAPSSYETHLVFDIFVEMKILKKSWPIRHCEAYIWRRNTKFI